MPRNLVLFDLEWNIGYKPYLFNYHGVQQTFRGEIIEIGAVKIDEDANVLDTFSIHLRPRIFRTLQHHIAKVTGLTQADLDRGEPIVQGLRRFMQWCGPDAEFAEWGMDDVPVLKQNLFLCNLDESRPTQWYDLQQIFLREHPRKEGEGMTLESVVTRMGIPMERPFHDALSDTLYTADVCRKLDLRAGLAAYPTEEESLRASLCPAPGDYRDFRVFRGYVEQSTWRSDPKIITASCPVCGGNEPLTNALIALPGVDGLNAVEHLRTLCPQTRIIWCSDLNFSLHAFRLRADYFLLEPVTEDALRQGFCSWLDKKAPLRSDRNEHNKENGL